MKSKVNNYFNEIFKNISKVCLHLIEIYCLHKRLHKQIKYIKKGA